MLRKRTDTSVLIVMKNNVRVFEHAFPNTSELVQAITGKELLEDFSRALAALGEQEEKWVSARQWTKENENWDELVFRLTLYGLLSGEDVDLVVGGWGYASAECIRGEEIF